MKVRIQDDESLMIIFFFVPHVSHVRRSAINIGLDENHRDKESQVCNCHGSVETDLAVGRFTCAEEPKGKK